MRSRLEGLPHHALREGSARILATLESWPAWRNAGMVVSFYPMDIEPDIVPALRKKMAGCPVCLVRTPPEDGGLLEARTWDGRPEVLVPHPRLPLLEVPDTLPLFDLSPWAHLVQPAVPNAEPAIALVPAWAFTPQGVRLGRGKGWYDRFLAHWPGLMRVGVCFREQMLAKLPEEVWDLRMDRIICEDQMLVCSDRFRT